MFRARTSVVKELPRTCPRGARQLLKVSSMGVLQFRMSNGAHVTLNARPESIVIMQNNDRTYTFDYSGRFVGAFRDGRNYRRSFANQILEKQSGPRGGLSGRLRRMLPADQVRALECEAYDFTHTVASELRQYAAAHDGATLEGARDALARVNMYCYTGLEREREIYEHIYHPVTMLPPDQYLALYLQMTEGCAYNQCAFCNLYQDRRFHIKRPEVFHEHIRRVRAFLGEGLRMRHTIFLGDANALIIPQKLLLPRFDIVNDEFAIVPRGLDADARKAWCAEHPVHFDGIHSFIDAFSTKQKRASDFAALAERGLRRVYIGLETGDAELLRFLGKPNTPNDVAHLVQECKAGGVAVGLIILVGAGGAQFEHAHIQHTTELINALTLDEHDLIYLSELIDFPDSPYSKRAAAANLQPLTFEQVERQMQIMRDAFRSRDSSHAPRVSMYDVREFVY